MSGNAMKIIHIHQIFCSRRHPQLTPSCCCWKPSSWLITIISLLNRGSRLDRKYYTQLWNTPPNWDDFSLPNPQTTEARINDFFFLPSTSFIRELRPRTRKSLLRDSVRVSALRGPHHWNCLFEQSWFWTSWMIAWRTNSRGQPPPAKVNKCRQTSVNCQRRMKPLCSTRYNDTK